MKKAFLFALPVLILLTSCATTAVFKTSKVTPAAEGKVKVKDLKNGNFNITVSIHHLADPDRLTPSRKHYVVWNKSDEGTFNLGKLTKGEEDIWTLTTESTYEPKRIFISAEDEEDVTKMGKLDVLKSKKL